MFTEGSELHRVRVELTGRYGTELREVVDHARGAAAAVIEEFLGVAMPEGGIDIAVTDIVDGDPASFDREAPHP